MQLLNMEDDYGPSYVIRGAKNYVNNNLIFAEHQWKIVRINGDGSIRIVYNGECTDNECEINTTGSETTMGSSSYNPRKDNKYVGYMYGDISDNYDNAHKNENNSTMKIFLDNWYEENILETRYNEYISDNTFCNDRKVYSGGGYGTQNTKYMAQYKLDTIKTPKLKCTLQNDRFTVNDVIVGNGSLTYPIGLLNVDEANVAGAIKDTNNPHNYLYNNSTYWLMSPWDFSNQYDIPRNIRFSSTGGWFYSPVSTSFGVRGVLNLNPETVLTGSGSSTDPFIVQ